MKLTFECGSQKIHYTLVYKKRNNIAINITEQSEVQVLAPIGCSVFSVMDKVKGNATWILAELEKRASGGQATQEATEAEDREAVCTYLGKNYGVKVIHNEEKEVPTVKLVRGKLEVEMKDITPQGLMLALRGWYQQKVTDKAKEKLKGMKDQFEKVPKKIQTEVLTGQLYRLDGDVLVLHGAIGKGPVQVLEYVLVQALCAYNNKAITDASVQPLLEGEALAKEWLAANK